METLVQVVTVALAVVAIIGHQQRTILSLCVGHTRVNEQVVAIIWHQQRTIDKLRDDTDRGLEKLGAAVVSNGERLARIEGSLGIGMHDAAASKAAGATRPKQEPGKRGGARADLGSF